MPERGHRDGKGGSMSEVFLSSSEVAAHGARLARVEVVSAYPITPNTGVIGTLTELIETGQMDATTVNVEGEHSAASVCAGASSAGVRAFTATCGQGMAFMHEVLWMASGMALPMVVAVTSRGVGSPQTIVSDFSDIMMERDASYLQFYTENAQEVIDSIIMAYKIGENPDVLLPSFVCLEAFRMTHTYEPVEIPDQEKVDAFLPPYRPKHAFYDTDYPIQQGTGSVPDFTYRKYQQHTALIKAKDVIKDACREFEEIFGRKYGLVDAHKVEDAEVVVVSMGCTSAVARKLVNEYREKGVRIGSLKIRVFRPFPEEEIKEALSGAKKVIVIDRFNSPGSHGVLYTEIKSALYDLKPVITSYIVGHEDIFFPDMEKMIDKALQRDDGFEEWYNLFQPDEFWFKASGSDRYEQLKKGEKVEKIEREDVKDTSDLMAKGLNLCPGCTPYLVCRKVLTTLGKDTVVPYATGCVMAATSGSVLSGWKVPAGHYCFTNVASAASGIKVALERQGKDYNVVAIGGDGGIADIGFQALSGAVERGHRIIYVCYDNEAYMNTGVQRSSTTSYLAQTKTTLMGKQVKKKDIAKIMEAHGIYVATALPCFMKDMEKKILKAKDVDGPAFIHVLCPCPTGWSFDPALGIEMSRLAFETGAFILYESYKGKRTISRLPKERKPIDEYLKLQGRFSHLSADQIKEIQEDIDERFMEMT
jgi:pyruvate ferredoxin oxidoreductase alpha subunit